MVDQEEAIVVNGVGVAPPGWTKKRNWLHTRGKTHVYEFYEKNQGGKKLRKCHAAWRAWKANMAPMCELKTSQERMTSVGKLWAGYAVVASFKNWEHVPREFYDCQELACIFKDEDATDSEYES